MLWRRRHLTVGGPFASFSARQGANCHDIEVCAAPDGAGPLHVGVGNADLRADTGAQRMGVHGGSKEVSEGGQALPILVEVGTHGSALV